MLRNIYRVSVLRRGFSGRNLMKNKMPEESAASIIEEDKAPTETTIFRQQQKEDEMEQYVLKLKHDQEKREIETSDAA